MRINVFTAPSRCVGLTLCLIVYLLAAVFSLSIDAQAVNIKPVRSAILFDLRETKITAKTLQAAIHLYTSSTKGNSAVFVEPPIILDSNGNLLDALAVVGALVSNKSTFPDVLFLVESAVISIGVSDVLKRNSATADITIVSAHTSNPKLCDRASNPNTVCVVPQDALNVRALLETVSTHLRWYSVAMVFSNDAYGTGVHSVVSSQLSMAKSVTTVVNQVFIKAGGSTADDDAVIREILRFRPVGIISFVSENEFLRLRGAIKRAGKQNDLFLLSSRESLNVQHELVGSSQPLVPLWGALFVSQHTSMHNLIAKGYFEQDYLDSYGAYVVSHLFDAMQAVVNAKSVSPKDICATRFVGFSGTVAFDTITGQRMEVTYSLVSKTHTIDQPLLTWSINGLSDDPEMTNFNPTALESIIPESPLRAATVCVTSPDSCSEVESVNALIYVLLQRNKQTAHMSGATTFIPLAINAGDGGVEGLVSLISIARSCSVLAGPGRGRVALALNPVINQFGIAQLDFNVAEELFSDRLAYPYFSRSIPQNRHNYLVYGEVCSRFGWERVIILTANDQFGNAQATSMLSSMQQRNVYVEQVYRLNNNSKASVVDVLTTIHNRDISRVVIVLLPLLGEDAKMWFSLFGELDFMKNYIFFLGKELCQYSDLHPEERNKAQSSLCVYPYVSKDKLETINKEFDASGLFDEQMRILTEGGFGSEVWKCNLTSIRPVSAFAVDAAYTIINAVERAVKAGVSLNASINLIPFITSTSLDNFTGPFTIDKTGNRDVAAFTVNIQNPNTTVGIGMWSLRQSPAFIFEPESTIIWMTGEKDAPQDTFRDISFILGTTVIASPGAIAISVLGFVGTVAVFAFCYHHYKMQRLVERSLESNRVPVTENELRELRGENTRRKMTNV